VLGVVNYAYCGQVRVKEQVDQRGESTEPQQFVLLVKADDDYVEDSDRSHRRDEVLKHGGRVESDVRKRLAGNENQQQTVQYVLDKDAVAEQANPEVAEDFLEEVEVAVVQMGVVRLERRNAVR
jgi:hypothetical protein